MDRYLGLDAHAASCTLAVVGPSGKRLKSLVVETNGQALVQAVRDIPGRLHLCLEEGELSAWLCELFEPHVEELAVVVPRATKGRPKDDLRDAWSRAEELRIGAIGTRVYKAPLHLTALKNAVRAYNMAVRDVSRVKNRLKAVLRSRGVLADASVYDKESRPEWIKQLPVVHRRLAEWLGEELDQLLPLRDKAEEWLLEEAKTHPIIHKLESGIKPNLAKLTLARRIAATVLSMWKRQEVYDPERHAAVKAQTEQTALQ